MKPGLKFSACLSVIFFLSFTAVLYASENNHEKNNEAEELKLSPQTQACIGCHSMLTPGIVADWRSSRHSRTVPSEAVKKPMLQRRISAESLPDEVSGYVVGCFECHSKNPQKHKDNFEHMGFRINVVVSPGDCNTCHPVEVGQFAPSKKAHAIKNLIGNPVYHTLADATTGVQKLDNGRLVSAKPSESTLHETCLGCHGTRVEFRGMKKVSTKMGEISVPDLANWPNQGVGRENPDGTEGACTACHPRHAFSIEVARKPYTCGQCHHEPDVPAWNVYEESKHGNIFHSKNHEWDFDPVPWVIGKDFKTPTCSVCHNSLVVRPDGEVVAERSHNFGSRLWVRLFGLIYSHAQPRSGDTSIIKNKDGLPLPTTFSGGTASEYLIDKAEQQRRMALMKSVCFGCHSTDWANGHFRKLDNTIEETDEMVRTSTMLMTDSWDKGVTDKTDPFDEPIEKMWVKQWLFYSNSIRYSSAMTGAPDYTSFKLGWWELSDILRQMKEAIEVKYRIKLLGNDRK
jgi:hydroxylamine dehydrogenase